MCLFVCFRFAAIVMCYITCMVPFPNETHHSLRTRRETTSWSPEMLVSKNGIPEILNLTFSLFYCMIPSLLNIPIYTPQESMKKRCTLLCPIR